MREEWRTIPGYPGYEVSNYGNTWSNKTKKILKTYTRGGYVSVTLCKKGRKPVNMYVHVVVALAFIGPRPAGMVVHHKNSDRTDARLINIEYVTRNENNRLSVHRKKSYTNGDLFFLSRKHELAKKWKEVADFPGYFVTRCGLVKNSKNLIMKPHKTCNGYYRVTLSKNKKEVKVLLHRAIANTFLGECPSGFVCNHKDGNPLNNHVDNLEWVSSSENAQHAYLIGLLKPKRGENHGMAKLNWTKVKAIRTQYPKKLLVELAKEFGVNRKTVRQIIHNERWYDPNYVSVKHH